MCDKHSQRLLLPTYQQTKQSPAATYILKNGFFLNHICSSWPNRFHLWKNNRQREIFSRSVLATAGYKQWEGWKGFSVSQFQLLLCQHYWILFQIWRRGSHLESLDKMIKTVLAGDESMHMGVGSNAPNHLPQQMVLWKCFGQYSLFHHVRSGCLSVWLNGGDGPPSSIRWVSQRELSREWTSLVFHPYSGTCQGHSRNALWRETIACCGQQTVTQMSHRKRKMHWSLKMQSLSMPWLLPIMESYVILVSVSCWEVKKIMDVDVLWKVRRWSPEPGRNNAWGKSTVATIFSKTN